MSARAGVAVLLGACAGAPLSTPANAPPANPPVDAGAIEDASPPEASVDARTPWTLIPPLDPPTIPGFAVESHADVAVNGDAAIDIAFADDSCVRVAFHAGDLVSASLADDHADHVEGGLLGIRGAVCERAGKHLTLVFTGNANVRYAVLRSLR